MVRYKNRYVVAEWPADACSVSKVWLLQEITDLVQRLLGDWGVGAMQGGLDVKYLNPATRLAVVRVRHGPHRMLQAALATMSRPVRLRALKVTATILRAFRFIRGHQLAMLERTWKQAGAKPTPAQKKTLEGLQDMTYFHKLNMLTQ